MRYAAHIWIADDLSQSRVIIELHDDPIEHAQVLFTQNPSFQQVAVWDEEKAGYIANFGGVEDGQ